jgi:subtilisin family serine protease
MIDADIAIIDSGVAFHPDLNLAKERCFTFSSDPRSPPSPRICKDGSGHGTRVAGVAAAINNDFGTVGAAPGARIWALDVCDPLCDPNAKLSAYRFVADHANEIDVVNISLGDPLGRNFAQDKKAIENIISKGVVVVVSAGNENRDVKGRSPAGIPAAITVSAIADSDGKCGGEGRAWSVNKVTNPDDFILSTSNFGPGVDFAAPGNFIRTTAIKGGYDNTASDTSVAAPHVAGAAALLKSINPNATPAEIEAKLHKDATKPPSVLGPGVAPDPRKPCDGHGRGYFVHIYHDSKVMPRKGHHFEDLLYMGDIGKPDPP